MSRPPITLLITLTGRDRPGVTSRLFSVLAAHELSVIDVEQVVIHGRLVLGVLLSCDHAPDLTAIHRQVATVAADLDLEAEITTGSGEPARRRGSLHVTVLGSPLARRHRGHRRPDRGQRRQHRPDRKARAPAGDLHRVRRVRG
jgi:phosphoserine phosphatase